jgi:hypothetical protein
MTLRRFLAAGALFVGMPLALLQATATQTLKRGETGNFYGGGVGDEDRPVGDQGPGARR